MKRIWRAGGGQTRVCAEGRVAGVMGTCLEDGQESGLSSECTEVNLAETRADGEVWGERLRISL